VLALISVHAAAQSQPEGHLIIAFDTSIAATYFDPAETAGLQTPFVFLYALHDALVEPLPGDDQAPSLAESWTESPDGLVYEFTLRQGLTFHNGDPFSAEDVRFSFLRYKGTSAKLLHERVKAVEVIDAHRLRFVLHEPWPDFLTFYATLATGAAWVVPKKYLEQVGDDGFKRHPVGLGPYRFVRSDPGVELVLEADERYWRKVSSIKRIIFKGIPESPTRLAMLKTGEADIAYLMYREEGARSERTRSSGWCGPFLQSRGTWTSPSNGTQNLPGMTSACGLLSTMPSTGRRSTRWSGLASAG
jgi:peptide/nickel transport system substrate-binding protein